MATSTLMSMAIVPIFTVIVESPVWLFPDAIRRFIIKTLQPGPAEATPDTVVKANTFLMALRVVSLINLALAIVYAVWISPLQGHPKYYHP